MITKPMLSGSLDNIRDAKYPVLATPKLDGIRCLKINGKTLSRKFKPIPNQHVQKLMEFLPDGLDGELMVKGNFNQVQSSIMSEDGEPNFTFYIFDYVKDNLDKPYTERIHDLKVWGQDDSVPDWCVLVLPTEIKTESELSAYETQALLEGYEGVMLRKPDGRYKCGRSGDKEGLLLKLKQFKDSEARVVGFVEQMHNDNVAEKDELGHTKRSSHKENMIPANTLGKFVVEEIGDVPWKGKQFSVGTGEGLTAELRKKFWDNRDEYLGKVITYKYQPHGIKDLPRLPIWKGFRDERDIS